MKRLIACALCILAAAPSGAEIDRAAIIALAASVLKVEAQRPQGGFSLGSAVVVAPEQVVTNCHVTRDALRVNVLRGGRRWLAEAERSNVFHDLCTLRVRGLGAGTVALGQADTLQPGQAVTALGYTGGMGLQNSHGTVLALHRFDDGRVIRMSNGFSSGASGGGLFDADLQLVGILTFRLRGGEAHYFAAPVAWLRALLDAPRSELNAQPDRPRGAAYWERPVAEQPRFLQAALLQRDQQWPQLATLAADWASDDASDPEPCTLLSLALTRMNQLPEPRQALACAGRPTTASGLPCLACATPSHMP